MTSEIPTVDQLRAMLALHEERAKVQRQLEAIDARLAALQSRVFPGAPQRSSARPAPEHASSKPQRAAREPKPVAASGAPKAPRNEFKARITAALGAAGELGASLKDLAENLGTNYRNVAVWFATTGKKNPQIEKIGPGRYRFAATRSPGESVVGSPEQPAPSPAAPSAPVPPESAPEAADLV